MRWPVTWTVIAMMLIHLVMFIERVLATRCKSNYEQMGYRFGVISTYLIWLTTCAVCYYSFTVKDYGAPLAYCLGTIPDNEERVRKLLAVTLPLDITITFGDFALQSINRRKKRTA
uniref:DUF1467 family protein n=2 Tax=Bursaphelenchus xylophilus TaxID=6326 RepID=A0A1I7RIM7_BURXY